MSTKYQYLSINICFIFILIMLYVSISNDWIIYFVPNCTCKSAQCCPSCGFTRCFKFLMNGNFRDAVNLNNNSIYIFVFYSIQLILRVLFSSLILLSAIKIKFVINIDIYISSALFIICYSQLIFACYHNFL